MPASKRSGTAPSSEALLFLTPALEVGGRPSGPDPRRALSLKGLGTAHYFLGDLQRAASASRARSRKLDRARPVRRAPASRAALAGAVGTQVAHLVAPRRYRGRRQADKDMIAEALGCYKIIGQIGYLDGEPHAEARLLHRRGLNLGEEAGPSPRPRADADPRGHR